MSGPGKGKDLCKGRTGPDPGRKTIFDGIIRWPVWVGRRLLPPATKRPECGTTHESRSFGNCRTARVAAIKRPPRTVRALDETCTTPATIHMKKCLLLLAALALTGCVHAQYKSESLQQFRRLRLPGLERGTVLFRGAAPSHAEQASLHQSRRTAGESGSCTSTTSDPREASAVTRGACGSMRGWRRCSTWKGSRGCGSQVVCSERLRRFPKSATSPPATCLRRPAEWRR